MKRAWRPPLVALADIVGAVLVVWLLSAEVSGGRVQRSSAGFRRHHARDSRVPWPVFSTTVDGECRTSLARSWT